ncbi:hypothetical protein DPMN_017564 [Dreissena polymorpha]|uniref:Uncharacterized protein n=1 Tax=Dreissena polymorpha TaxID=45954 RepID=A0A9D4S8A6_DREPO|nr:hypothetical protein DPMN_017564 [Dreissena polymorpha]
MYFSSVEETCSHELKDPFFTSTATPPALLSELFVGLSDLKQVCVSGSMSALTCCLPSHVSERITTFEFLKTGS